MPAKPYSPSHIAAVAGGFTELRLSGAVKAMLVEALCAELDRLVPQMEAATLAVDEERKTLDDAARTRLNYNRTRELMIDRLDALESVGSAAVQGAIEHLESYLATVLQQAGEAAGRDRVATIKDRHLTQALSHLAPSESNEDDEPAPVVGAEAVIAPEQVVVGSGGGMLTEGALVSIAKSHAGMPVTLEAARELLDLYYMYVDQVESDIMDDARFGKDPSHLLEHINRMRTLMGLGWMRRMLRAAADEARERGYRRIDIEQIVNIDPFAEG